MSIKIAKPLTAEWSRANARAIANAKLGRRAERVACKTYRVASAHGASAYTVTVDSIVNLEASCTCPHGQGGTAGVCWHKSAAIAAAVQRIAAAADARSAAVATAPAPAEQTAATVGEKMARFART